MPRPGFRRTNYRATPSSDSTNHVHSEPDSAWQILVEAKRAEKELGFKSLSSLTKIPQATLFNWVRSRLGGPPKGSYPETLNRRLAKALGIKPEELMAAYESSRIEMAQFQKEQSLKDPAGSYTHADRSGQPHQSPPGADSLARFMQMIDIMNQPSFTKEQIRSIAAVLDPSIAASPSVRN